jgi:hypothetical protein
MRAGRRRHQQQAYRTESNRDEVLVHQALSAAHHSINLQELVGMFDTDDALRVVVLENADPNFVRTQLGTRG